MALALGLRVNHSIFNRNDAVRPVHEFNTRTVVKNNVPDLGFVKNSNTRSRLVVAHKTQVCKLISYSLAQSNGYPKFNNTSGPEGERMCWGGRGGGCSSMTECFKALRFAGQTHISLQFWQVVNTTHTTTALRNLDTKLGEHSPKSEIHTSFRQLTINQHAAPVVLFLRNFLNLTSFQKIKQLHLNSLEYYYLRLLLYVCNIKYLCLVDLQCGWGFMMQQSRNYYIITWECLTSLRSVLRRATKIYYMCLAM